MNYLRKIRKVAWLLLRETIAEWKKDKVSNLAAALAYYTIFSLAPLLVIVIAIAGFFFGQDAVQREIMVQLTDLLGTNGASIVRTTLNNIQVTDGSDSLTASFIGLSVLFIGATGVFAQLQDALNTIWDVEPIQHSGIWTLVRTRLLSFSMVVGIGFLLLVSLVISTILSALNHFANARFPDVGFVLQLSNLILSYGVTTFLFAMIYKFLPSAKIYWRDVWIGAIFTTLLFTAGKSLLGLYIGRSGFSSAYGAAGSLVILIAWIYYSAQILFIGAEFTEVFARHYGSQIQPARQPAK